MNSSSLFKKYFHIPLALILFIVAALAYNSPVLSGKVMEQDDIQQNRAMAKETDDWREKYGEEPLWSGSMFSGMPTFLTSTIYPGNWMRKVENVLMLGLPAPANMMFVLFLGFFILMLCLRANPWVSIGGAIAFGLSTWFLISLSAGHNSKVVAIAYMAPVIGGLILAYRGKYLLGGAVTALFMGLELNTRHPQITFYLAMIVLCLIVYYAIESIRSKQIKEFLIASVVLAAAAGLGFGPNYSKYATTLDYTKETIRGGNSELTHKQAKTDGGLDRAYATRWSYGVGESWTVLLPDYRGGGYLDAKPSGEFYNQQYKGFVQRMKQSGMSQSDAEAQADKAISQYLYMNSTSTNPDTGEEQTDAQNGTVYIGVLFFLFFIYSLFAWKNNLKWGLLTAGILGLFLSWGNHFMGFYNIFFEMVPQFNKFRTPSMAMSILTVIIPMLAVVGISHFIQLIQEKSKGKAGLTNEQMKPMFYSFGITAGLVILLGILGMGTDGYSGANDDQLGQMLETIKSDRAANLRSDALRALLLLGAGFGAVWFYFKQKIAAPVFALIVSLLFIIDLWGVGRRALDERNFKEAKKIENPFPLSPAEQSVLADKSLHYRVFDLTGDPFNEAKTSYHFRHIGGYHPAKLYLYQDLIENQISRNNMAVLNMLDTKYIFQAKDGQVFVQQNPAALGAAWFVNSVQWAENADAEMKALDNFNPAQLAVVDQRFKEQLKELPGATATNGINALPFDSASFISLKEYKPYHLTYNSKSSQAQLAVFSEIWYKGNHDWKSYVDGKEVPHIRANYALRAMVVPAGEHVIEFKFKPELYESSDRISMIASAILMLVVAIAMGMAIMQEIRTKNEAAA